METLRKRSLIALVALVATTTCFAQTADDIIAKNIEAIGGKDVINSVKSLVIEQSIEVAGNEAPSTTYILTGKGFKNQTDFNGVQIITCFTDKGGWTVNPMVGQATATAMPADAVKASQGQMNPAGALFNYAATGGKVELVGKDTADYKIKLTNTGGLNAIYYINMKTYYIDRVETTLTMAGQSVDLKIRFSDYRKTVVGFFLPYTMQRELPQYTLNITNKKVDINTTIDPTIFDMPK